MKRWIQTFLCVALALGIVACKSGGETLTPLYEPEPIKLKNPQISIWTEVAPSTIEQSGIRRETRKLFNWIPLLGEVVESIFELPIDMVASLLPPIGADIVEELSSGPDGKPAEWNDPRLLSIVSHLSVGVAELSITPPNQRKNYRESQDCVNFRNCEDVEFDDFLSKVGVSIIFYDRKPGSRGVLDADGVTPLPKEKEIIIATADIETQYDKVDKTIYFDVNDMNMRPYLDHYNKYKAKVMVKGGFPKRTVYYQGRIRLDLVLKITE